MYSEDLSGPERSLFINRIIEKDFPNSQEIEIIQNGFKYTALITNLDGKQRKYFYIADFKDFCCIVINMSTFEKAIYRREYAQWFMQRLKRKELLHKTLLSSKDYKRDFKEYLNNLNRSDEKLY